MVIKGWDLRAGGVVHRAGDTRFKAQGLTTAAVLPAVEPHLASPKPSGQASPKIRRGTGTPDRFWVWGQFSRLWINLSLIRLPLIPIPRTHRKWQIPRCRCPLQKGARFDLNLDVPFFTRSHVRRALGRFREI